MKNLWIIIYASVENRIFEYNFSQKLSTHYKHRMNTFTAVKLLKSLPKSFNFRYLINPRIFYDISHSQINN